MATVHSVDRGQLSRVYRPDFAVRLRACELRAVVWKHSFSFTEAALLSEADWSSVSAGSTEWTAHFGDRLLTLGWDWMADTGGRVSCLKSVAPRSNLCILDRNGYDQAEFMTSQAIWEMLAEEFWHDTIRKTSVSSAGEWLN